jgi:exodeoxyribonuclease VII small subunit
MAKSSSPQVSFSQAIGELSSILERFKYESLPLEDSLALFEQGLQNVKLCQGTLNQAKGKLEVLQAQVEEVAPLQEEEDDTVTALPATHEAWPCERLFLSLPLTQAIDQDDLETVLKQLRLSFELKTQAKPVIYPRDNGSGFEALVPLSNGCVTLSTFKATLNDPALLLLAGHGVPTLNMSVAEVMEALEGMLPLQENA